MNILSPCFAALNNRRRASRAKKKSLLRSIKEAKQFNPDQLSRPMHKKHDIYLIKREITSKGSLSHLFWHSPILGHFWCDIFNWFSKQFGTNIQPDCNLAILGSSDRKKGPSFPIKNRFDSRQVSRYLGRIIDSCSGTVKEPHHVGTFMANCGSRNETCTCVPIIQIQKTKPRTRLYKSDEEQISNHISVFVYIHASSFR